MDTTIFGYMRFSYLGRSDARLTRGTDDLAQRARLLYAPGRMEVRFHFFERLCLPSLRTQSDAGFRLAILTSPEMPAPWRQRLERAVADIPQIEIVTATAPHVTHAINPWIAAQAVVHRTRTIHFRLDDDDALAADHIATLRAQLLHAPDHAIISRPSGLFLMNTPEGPALLAKFEPWIAIGYALVNPPGRIMNPYQLQHRGHYRTAPSVMLPGPFAYVHAAHPESDTGAAQAQKLALARDFHDRTWGRRPRRFRLRVMAQFAGRKPGHFLDILRKNLPPALQESTAPAPFAPGSPL